MPHKTGALILLIFLMLGLSCAPKPAQKIILTVGHNTGTDYHYHKGLEYFAKKVGEKTNGALTIKIIPDFDFATGSDIIKAFKENKLNLALVTSSDLADIVPQTMVFDLPYLFKNRSRAYRVLDGAVGNYISRLFPEKGLRNLAYWENGFKNLANRRKKILKTRDPRKLDFGIPNNKVIKLIFASLRAETKVVTLKDLYAAVKSRKVDGQDNPIALLYPSGLYEYQPFLSITKHAYSPALLLIDDKVYKKLSPKHQKALEEAAEEAKNYERLQSAIAEEEALEKLSDLGLKIYWPKTGAFKRFLNPVYKKAASEIGGGNLEKGGKLINSILDAK